MLVFENYVSRQKVAVNAFVCQVLDFCGEGKTFRELRGKFPDLEARALRSAIRQLLKWSLLEIRDKESGATARSWTRWESWNPAAGYFHFSTKDPKFEASEEGDAKGLRRIIALRPLPPRTKSYLRVKIVRLPKIASATEFPRVLLRRRTWRQFSRERVELEKFSQLLWLSFGVQGWARIPGVGRLALGTSPSGGAMRPFEAYVLARNVDGVDAGIYHYDAVGHRLELLREALAKAEIKKLLAGQTWSGEAAFVVLLTAVFQRTQWKYEHARAYRVVLAEAGHLCQTFCLTATWLGLAPFCTMALADSRIERTLHIDGVGESVIYAMGAGNIASRKPTAERWRV